MHVHHPIFVRAEIFSLRYIPPCYGAPLMLVNRLMMKIGFFSIVD